MTRRAPVTATFLSVQPSGPGPARSQLARALAAIQHQHARGRFQLLLMVRNPAAPERQKRGKRAMFRANRGPRRPRRPWRRRNALSATRPALQMPAIVLTWPMLLKKMSLRYARVDIKEIINESVGWFQRPDVFRVHRRHNSGQNCRIYNTVFSKVGKCCFQRGYRRNVEVFCASIGDWDSRL